MYHQIKQPTRQVDQRKIVPFGGRAKPCGGFPRAPPDAT
jgi:hypothetical protein